LGWSRLAVAGADFGGMLTPKRGCPDEYAATSAAVKAFFAQQPLLLAALPVFTSDHFDQSGCETPVYSHAQATAILDLLNRRHFDSRYFNRAPKRWEQLCVLAGLTLVGKAQLANAEDLKKMKYPRIAEEISRVRQTLELYNQRYLDPWRIVLPERTWSLRIDQVPPDHQFRWAAVEEYHNRRGETPSVPIANGKLSDPVGATSTILCRNCCLVQMPASEGGDPKNTLIVFTHRDLPPVSLLVHLLDLEIPYADADSLAHLPRILAIRAPSSPECRLIASGRVCLCIGPDKRLSAVPTLGERYELAWAIAEHICRIKPLPIASAPRLFEAIPLEPLSVAYETGNAAQPLTRVERVVIVSEGAEFSPNAFSSESVFIRLFTEALRNNVSRRPQQSKEEFQHAWNEVLTYQEWTPVQLGSFRRIDLPSHMFRSLVGREIQLHDNDREYSAAAVYLRTGYIPNRAPPPVRTTTAQWSLDIRGDRIDVSDGVKHITFSSQDPEFQTLKWLLTQFGRRS